MKVLVAGAGIGGLTAALCLNKTGHDVEVFEQARELGEVGAGIQLGANAIRVMQHLGLQEEFERVVVRPEAVHMRLFSTGELLLSSQLGDKYEHDYGAPYYHVHRADLHNILADAFQAAVPGGIHLGCTVNGFEEHSDGITLEFADGSTAQGDLLVGADGLKSAVRDQILGEVPCNWTGNVAWRGILPTNRLPKGFMDTVVSNFVGPGKHMVIYYLRRQELVNFVGVVENDEWKEEGWTIKSPWKDLKADYAGWHETVQAVIDAVDKDECYRWALYNRLPVDNWSTDRATLLGDSAHATLPFMASGAAMAIEDARILDRALDQAGSTRAALELYQNNRFARTRRIQESSTAMGGLYHLPNEDAFRQAFANMGNSDGAGRWLPEYDPNTIKLT
ncbi:MAG TPA: monooxygenase [Candidatus Latescibacteria bacterium]|nr:monooxygenase [Candidatus Latescibacterota bacterium]